jgi:hypothetical protein
MKKLFSVAAASLIVVGTANAQGTWYTDYNTWLTQMTSIGGTADYNSYPAGDLGVTSISENGVTLSNNSLSDFLWSVNNAGTPLGQITSGNNTDTLTFTFNGNAFGGRFLATDPNDNYIDVPLSFATTDGGTYGLLSVSDSAPFTFLGYISNSNSPISLDILGSANFATVDSFSFGNGTNTVNPGSAVPEPGEYVSMAILGIGLCGMIVRSRRIKKS